MSIEGALRLRQVDDPAWNTNKFKRPRARLPSCETNTYFHQILARCWWPKTIGPLIFRARLSRQRSFLYLPNTHRQGPVVQVPGTSKFLSPLILNFPIVDLHTERTRLAIGGDLSHQHASL